MTEQPTPKLLSVRQVAALLSCSPSTVWNRVRASKLPKPVKWEGCTRWRMADLERFIEGMKA